MQERLSKKTYTLLTSMTMPTGKKQNQKKNKKKGKPRHINQRATELTLPQLKGKVTLTQKKAEEEDEAKAKDKAKQIEAEMKKKGAKRHKLKNDDDTMDVSQDFYFTAAQSNTTIEKLLKHFVDSEVAYAAKSKTTASTKIIKSFGSGVSFKAIVTNACTANNFRRHLCQFNIRNVRAQCAEFKRALRSKSNSIALHTFELLCRRANVKERTPTISSVKSPIKNKNVLNELFFRAKLEYPGHQAGLDDAFFNALQQEQNDCRDDAIEYKVCIATFQQMFIDTWVTFLCTNTSARNGILSWIQNIRKCEYNHTTITNQIGECANAWEESVFYTGASHKRPPPGGTATGFAIY